MMTVVSRLKVQADRQQVARLRQTMAAYNAASNTISRYAWENNIYRQYDLHHALYREIRAQFPTLRANHVVRCIARVAQAYQVLNRQERQAYVRYKKGEADHWYRERRSFKWRSGMALDGRLWGFRQDGRLSLATSTGRIQVGWQADQHNRQLLAGRTGAATLVYRRGQFYLHVACAVAEQAAYAPTDWLGVDMGVTNLAVTSDGAVWTNAQIEARRVWYAERRATLQAVGTASAKRRLQQLSGREKRFKRDVDHCISRAIVTQAERTGRGIAVEQLTGIRDRTRALRRAQRPRHHAWSFARLQAYIGYKARIRGVPVVAVDPAYTSQTCAACGCVDQRSRQSQSVFRCVACGYEAHADLNAACNIRTRAIQHAYGGSDPQTPQLAAG